jgi:hypothetical protein
MKLVNTDPLIDMTHKSLKAVSLASCVGMVPVNALFAKFLQASKTA